jgi:hypothetical protein
MERSQFNSFAGICLENKRQKSSLQIKQRNEVESSRLATKSFFLQFFKKRRKMMGYFELSIQMTSSILFIIHEDRQFKNEQTCTDKN